MNRVPVPIPVHRVLVELWGEIEDGFVTENVYNVDDLIIALEVATDEGEEDTQLALHWLRSHRADYLRGVSGDGFEPIE